MTEIRTRLGAYPEAFLQEGQDGVVLVTSKGISIREYAAIHLKVPDSGNEELDRMIRKAVRREIAADLWLPNIRGENTAIAAADLFLAELEKEPQ